MGKGSGETDIDAGFLRQAIPQPGKDAGAAGQQHRIQPRQSRFARDYCSSSPAIEPRMRVSDWMFSILK